MLRNDIGNPSRITNLIKSRPRLLNLDFMVRRIASESLDGPLDKLSRIGDRFLAYISDFSSERAGLSNKLVDRDAPVCLQQDIHYAIAQFVSYHYAIRRPIKLKQPGKYANFIDIAKARLIDRSFPLDSENYFPVTLECMVKSKCGLLAPRSRSSRRATGRVIPKWRLASVAATCQKHNSAISRIPFRLCFWASSRSTKTSNRRDTRHR
jgi:hypothetical protein